MTILASFDLFDVIGWAFLAGDFALMGWSAWRGYSNLVQRQIVRGSLAIICCLGMFGCGAYIGLIPGTGFIREGFYCQALFGRWMMLSKARLTYDSPRAFNGDGYSIDVIDMSEEFWSWLEANKVELIADYPKKPSIRSEWEQVLWHKTPITDAETNYLEFATVEYGESEGQLAQARELLLKLATADGSIIAYCHKTVSYGIADIDFYLLNPRAKVFIRVNHNT